jgi:hypothetical protein
MSIRYGFPKKRLKPLLLREIKSEALLVFCRRLLAFTKLNKENAKDIFSSSELQKEALFVEQKIEKLTFYFELHIVGVDYFEHIVKNYKEGKNKKLFRQEKPLIYYYDELIIGLENYMENKTTWIPELLIFIILSQWFVEENNSMKLYYFLQEYDFNSIIGMYEKISFGNNTESKETVLDMYRLSDALVKRLQTAKLPL